MNIKVKIGDLFTGLDLVNGTIDRKGKDSPVYFFAEKNEQDPKQSIIKVYSTSFSQGETLTQIPAEVTEEGRFGLHSDQLYIGLQGKDKNELISISSQGTEPYKIKTKRGQFKVAQLVNNILTAKAPLNHLNLDEDTKVTSIKPDLFLDVLSSVESAAASADTKASGYILQAIKITFGNELVAEATDTLCAACSTIPISGTTEKSFIIPPHIMKLLKKFIVKEKGKELSDLIIRYSNNKLFFQYEHSILGIGTYDQLFPPVKKLFDSKPTTEKVVVTVSELKALLTTATAFLDAPDINLFIEKDIIRVDGTNSSNTFTEFIEANGNVERKYKIKGPELVKLLNSMLTKTVELHVVTPQGKISTPLYLQSKSDSGIFTQQVVTPRN